MFRILSISQVTILEVVRQPLGLMLNLLISILMLFAPAYTSFNLGNGAELLRSNLLSTFLAGGLLFVSLISTNIVQQEINSKTILSLLSRPISLPAIYFGKVLGLIGALVIFFMVISSVAWMSSVIGTPDTASTVLNYTPLMVLIPSLISLSLAAVICNYLLGYNIVSFIQLGWFYATPVIVVSIFFLTQALDWPMPEEHIVEEFIKSAILIFFLLSVITSFSVSFGTFTPPIVNLLFCMGFLMLGLLAPALRKHFREDNVVIATIVQMLPDFHAFWMADMINLERRIPIELLMACSFYAMGMILAFCALGIAILLRRDFS